MGHGGLDLDALVHRAGMEDGCLGAHERDARLGETPDPRVLPQRREEAALLPLALEAQGDDRVGAVEGTVEVRLVLHAAREIAAAPRERHERRRSGERDRRTEGHERVDVRARDAAVEDVADDDDPTAGEITESGAQGVRVEETLCRVCVPSVAGVDDRARDPLGDEVRRA